MWPPYPGVSISASSRLVAGISGWSPRPNFFEAASKMSETAVRASRTKIGEYLANSCRSNPAKLAVDMRSETLTHRHWCSTFDLTEARRGFSPKLIQPSSTAGSPEKPASHHCHHSGRSFNARSSHEKCWE